MVDHTQGTRGCMRRNVDTGEYAASSLVRKYHDHYYTTKDRSLSVNNTENEKYNAFFYLTDCSPYEDRSNRSLTSLLSGLICYDRNAWPKTWQSHDLLTAGCDILHRHKRIYLSSWPWLPTVTMPDHRVITTFTLVKFLLSFAAFTKVSVSVYTRKMFT